ncbi:MAG: TonB-dependent receptor [Firmicutes bacterium]|nr:TonB-dependent receptor [Bacillota bacterium]
MNHRLLRSAFCVLFLIPTSQATQQPAQLTGTVRDPSGATIAGAEVTAEPSDGRPASRTATDSAGRFDLSLPPGRYRVRIAHPQFTPQVRSMTLAAGESQQWDVRLELERLSAAVVVTAQAEPVTAQNSTAPVHAIPAEEIERRQAVTLISLLATTPGIGFSRLGNEGGLTTLFLNGGNSNFTKFLVDGTPLNEPGGSLELSSFTVDNISKIEVVRGAASALYGSDALTGVVQVFTHRGRTTTPALDLLAEGGQFGTGHGRVRLSGARDGFDYSAAVAHLFTDGELPNDYFRNTTFSSNVGVQLPAGHMLRLALRQNTSDAGAPGQTLYTPVNRDQHHRLKHFTAHLSWEFFTGARWRHRLAGSETNLRQRFENPTSDFCFPDPPFLCDFPFSSGHEINRAGVSQQSSYLFPQGTVSFGYQFEVENGFLNSLHARRNNHGGYLDARLEPMRRLVLTAGFRVEGNDSFGVEAVPRIGASYTVRFGRGFWGATRLRISFGQGIKEPTLTQSFSGDPCFPGNPALRPERSRTLSAGIEQALAEDRVRVALDWFDNLFRDIASFTFCLAGGPCPVPPPPGCGSGFFGTFFNTDRARARGLNLSVEAKPVRWLQIAGHYSYVDSRVLESPNASDPSLIPGNRLFRRPVHSGSLLVGVAAWRTYWNLTGIFVGRRTDSDFLSLRIGNDCFGPCQTSNPGYVRIDLAVSYTLGRGATLFGRVENLFDKPYQDALGFPAYGLNAQGGLRFRLGGE